MGAAGAAHAGLACSARAEDGSRFCTAVLRDDVIRAMELAQEQSRWCWAAAASMVLRRYGASVSQREIVTDWFGAPFDKAVPTRHLADVVSRASRLAPGQMTQARATVLAESLHLSDERIRAGVVARLAADEPLLLSAGGHALVLVGVIYKDDNAAVPGPVVGALVIDPMPSVGLRFAEAHEMQPKLLVQVEVPPRADKMRSARAAPLRLQASWVVGD
jgi:hypothetical protein